MKNQTYLIDVDMLLDTRLGTLAKMNPEYPTIVLSNGWHHRPGDFYEQWIQGFNRKEFDRLWAVRDNETMSLSLPTAYLPELVSDLNFMYTNSINHPHVEGNVLKVNIYPFLLTDDERDVLADIMRGYVGNGIKVEVVRIPPEDLTPERIRTEIDVMVRYDFDDWFTLHHEELLENKMPSKIYKAPLLLKKPLDTIPEIDYFTATSAALSEHISLEWLGVKMASIFEPVNPQSSG